VDRFGGTEMTEVTTVPADPDATEPDTAKLGQALADAAAEIDVYVGAQYTLPLPSVPEVLKRICCDVARYRLWEDKAPDEIRKRYEDAIRLLDRIAKGTASLGFSDPAPAPAGGVAFVAPPRIMKGLGY
jgi:phage gp36-like protein